MAPAPRPSRRDNRPTPKTRAEEAADVQRRLKREAAERREAAAGQQPPARRGAGLKRTP